MRMASRSRLRAAWPGGASAALGLFAGVVDLERENGEPVDDEAGRLGVERGAGVGQAPRFEPGRAGQSNSSARSLRRWLVWSMRCLTCGQLRVGDAGGAGFVLDVPEIEVGAMLAGDGVEPIGGRRRSLTSVGSLAEGCLSARRASAGPAGRRLRRRKALRSGILGDPIGVQASMVELSSPGSPRQELLASGRWGAAGTAQETRTGDWNEVACGGCNRAISVYRQL